jgi:hypothetical protein
MRDLISLLEEMQASNSQNTEETPLTPVQISGTLYLTRLALSRLLLIYSNQTSISKARHLYLQAIQHKWKIDEQSVLSLSRVEFYLHNLIMSNCMY